MLAAIRNCGCIVFTIYKGIALELYLAHTTQPLSMSLVYVVFVVALFECCTAGFFELSDDTSLNVFRESDAVSHLQCALSCNGDIDCDEFGFSTTGHCFFSSNNVGITGEARDVTADMTVYRKPRTKVILCCNGFYLSCYSKRHILE